MEKRTVIIRKPCFFHAHCDETAVGILHRSAKEGQPSKEEWEKMCWVCEKVLKQAGNVLRTKGVWKCPVCGIVTKADSKTKTVTPIFSYWYDGYSIIKK